jgi:hypothetical protein
MADNDKTNLDKERIEAFFKSPLGFWTVIVVIGAIVLWAIGGSVVQMIWH